MKKLFIPKILISITFLSFFGCTSIQQEQEKFDKQPEASHSDFAKGGTADTYKNIPVVVTGIPYGYKDICGNHSIDSKIDKLYDEIEKKSQKITKIIFNFNADGSLDVRAYYINKDGEDDYDGSTWVESHSHGGDKCSDDRLDDIAIAQAKLNEMRLDPSLDKIYNRLLSVATDMDYDFSKIGITGVKYADPNILKGACGGYSNLLIERLKEANIEGVSDIVEVTSQNHAWVTLMYNGKKLYLDGTWFDGNTVDEKGVVVNIPDKDPRYITFDEQIFTNYGAHHIHE